MNRMLERWVLVVLVLLTVAACKSDQERSAESLEAFAEAMVIHRAPYHAYALLDRADKDYISVEEWATGFEEREPHFPVGTAITMGDLSIKGDRAEANIKITPPTGEPETRKYVLRRDGTKWRIFLGLKQLDEMRAVLADAKRVAEDGAVEPARDKVEQVAERGFDASMPDVIEREIILMRQRLGNTERFVELEKRFTAAMAGDLAKMKEEYTALAGQVGPDDEAFYPRLESLKKEIQKVERQRAMENFEFGDVRAKQIRDAWGVFQEVRFEAKNNTGRPLSKLAVRIDLLNEGVEAPVGNLVWQLVEEGGTLQPNDVVKVKREVEKAPEAWSGQQIAVRVDELQFADGEKDDDAG